MAVRHRIARDWSVRVSTHGANSGASGALCCSFPTRASERGNKSRATHATFAGQWAKTGVPVIPVHLSKHPTCELCRYPMTFPADVEAGRHYPCSPGGLGTSSAAPKSGPEAASCVACGDPLVYSDDASDGFHSDDARCVAGAREQGVIS